MNVRQRPARVAVGVCGQEADCLRRRHHHAHRRGELLDPLVVAEGGHALTQGGVAAGEDGVALERAPHARPQLQYLNLHRDDPGEHHSEHGDPPATADQSVEQPVIREREDERTDPPTHRGRARAMGGPAGKGDARNGRGACAGSGRRAAADRAADTPRSRRPRALTPAAMLRCCLACGFRRRSGSLRERHVTLRSCARLLPQRASGSTLERGHSHSARSQWSLCA